jgi:two-component system, response regulator PdtaR
MSGNGAERNAARVLVVEDEFFIALDLSDRLQEAGFLVAGPAAAVEEAMRLLDEAPCDVAVLDIHLGPRETSEPVAIELKARGIPFLTVTGFTHEQRPIAYGRAPLLLKPVRGDELLATLKLCLDDPGTCSP